MATLCEHIAAAGATYRSMPRFKGSVWLIAPVTAALMALIVLVHVAVELAGGSQDGWTLARFGANLALATRGSEPWRLITSMFLHAGWLHLLVNMYTLFIMGRFVEQLYGSRRFWIIYVLAGVVGSAASAYLGGPQRLSVGASGAIFGLLGAGLVGMIRLRGHVPEAWRKQVATNLLVVIALNFYIGYAIPRVDNSAHMGGLVGGVLVGLLLIRARAGQGGGTAASVAGRRLLTPLALTLAAVTILSGAMAALSTSRGLLERLPRAQMNQGGLSVTAPAHWMNMGEKELVLQDVLLDWSPTLHFEVLDKAADLDLVEYAAAYSREKAARLASIKQVRRARVHGSPTSSGAGLARATVRAEAEEGVFHQVHLFRRVGQLVIIGILRLPAQRVEAYSDVLDQVQRSMTYRRSGTM